MKYATQILLILWVFLHPIFLTAQTVNTGMLYVSEQTTFSTVSDFSNEPSASFYNDGRSNFYGDIYNQSKFDFYQNTGTIRLVGSKLQRLKGDFLAVNNLYLDNITPVIAFSLEAELNIYNQAYFQLGVLKNRKSDAQINFLNEAIARNASHSSHVDGPVFKFGKEDFTYPIGHKSYYRPASLQQLPIENIVESTYFFEDAGDLYDRRKKEGLIDRISHTEYWEVKIYNPAEAVLSLSYDNSTTPSYILNHINQGDAIHIVRWNERLNAWVDLGGMVDIDAKTVSTTINKAGIYTLALMKFNEINPCDIVVYNAVTPNQDGFNDYLKIINDTPDCAKNLKVQIFNRWGVKVFETDTYGLAGHVFDGYSTGRLTVREGSKLPSGTYFYVLEYQYNENQIHKKMGYIHLSST